jgi:cytochrome c oxidase assembly factor CtaG
MGSMVFRSAWRRTVASLVAAVSVIVVAAPTAAHGVAPSEPPSPAILALGWSFEPAVILPLLLGAMAWQVLVRRVNRVHPGHPVPNRRSAAFFGGLLTIAIALQSGIERYDTTLFSIHMVQHVLLTLVAAPLLALGAPVTLLLRAMSPAARRRWVLPALHSRAARFVGHPIVAALLFAAVMWATHFSPLFDRALEDRLAHDVEHILLLGSAVLFWWPAVGLDPGPYRLSHAVRILYTFVQMPQNTFLAVAIAFAPAPLYPHYATLARDWGPDPLLDQQIAGGIMWIVGDLLFLVAILGLLVSWSRREATDRPGADRRAAAQLAAIRARSAALEARRAASVVGSAPDEARLGRAAADGPGSGPGTAVDVPLDHSEVPDTSPIRER